MFSPRFGAANKVNKVGKMKLLLQPLYSYLAAYAFAAIDDNGLISCYGFKLLCYFVQWNQSAANIKFFMLIRFTYIYQLKTVSVIHFFL